MKNGLVALKVLLPWFQISLYGCIASDLRNWNWAKNFRKYVLFYTEGGAGGKTVSEHLSFLLFLFSRLMFGFFIFFFSVVPPHLLFFPPFPNCGRSLFLVCPIWSLELCSESVKAFCKVALSVGHWGAVLCRSNLEFFNSCKFSLKLVKDLATMKQK